MTHAGRVWRAFATIEVSHPSMGTPLMAVITSPTSTIRERITGVGSCCLGGSLQDKQIESGGGISDLTNNEACSTGPQVQAEKQGATKTRSTLNYTLNCIVSDPNKPRDAIMSPHQHHAFCQMQREINFTWYCNSTYTKLDFIVDEGKGRLNGPFSR